MQISKKSQYGLRAMVYLARFPQKIHSLKTISKTEGMPFDYLEKIISKLEKAGFVKSKKGVQGGYFLAKKPAKIKIGKIIRTLEGDISLVKCITKEGGFICPRKKNVLLKIFGLNFKKTLIPL